jgi:hypothetical protein
VRASGLHAGSEVRLRVDDRVDELGHGTVEVREAIKQSSVSTLVNKLGVSLQSRVPSVVADTAGRRRANSAGEVGGGGRICWA